MSIASLRPRTQVLISVLVPLVCLLVALFVVWPLVSHWRTAGRELQTTVAAIEGKEQVIAQAEASAQGRSLALAVALPSEQEPITFLRQFAQLCDESRTSLVSVVETTPPPPPAGASQVGGPTPVVPAAVSELANQVSVEGSFADVLSLLIRIEGFDRILSVNQCRISGAYPKLSATFTLSRFVAAAAPPPAASTKPATG